MEGVGLRGGIGEEGCSVMEGEAWWEWLPFTAAGAGGARAWSQGLTRAGPVGIPGPKWARVEALRLRCAARGAGIGFFWGGDA